MADDNSKIPEPDAEVKAELEHIKKELIFTDANEKLTPDEVAAVLIPDFSFKLTFYFTHHAVSDWVKGLREQRDEEGRPNFS